MLLYVCVKGRGVIMKFLLIFLLPICLFAKVDCNKHKIFCQIKKNKPSINNNYAMKLSNKIYNASLKYKIPANIYTAILMQESTYKLEAKKCQKGILTKEGKSFYKNTPKAVVCSDFGISQIHYKTVDRYRFDVDKLLTDLEYSVNSGAKVLSWFFKKYAHKDINWFSRYNCGTKSTTKRKTCVKYKKLVERYL